MKQNRLTYNIIKTAIEHGLSDMRSDPERSMRALADLGERFSVGDAQRRFFHLVQEELSDANSAYYLLCERLLQHTDADALTRFGLNLGYTGLIAGADDIRQRQHADGYATPWHLFVFCEDASSSLAPSAIASLVKQAKQQNIHSYSIFPGRTYPAMDTLLLDLIEEDDCAFLLFLHPHMLSDVLIQRVQRGKNIAIMVDMTAFPLSEARRCLDTLQQSNCIFGGYLPYQGTPNELVHLDAAYRTADFPAPFLVYVGERQLTADDHRMAPAEREAVKLRLNLRVPTMPLDLYSDVSAIQAIVTGAPFTATVHANSTMSFYPTGSDCPVGSVGTQTKKIDFGDPEALLCGLKQYCCCR